jgi:diacylglycerol kinase family enzyme
MRFDVVVNATAHLHRQRPGLAAHMRAVAAGRAEIHETADLGELDALAGRLAARGTDAVILSGGDGSFMAGATALARAFGDGALPRLGLLPGGTVATVARNWGMRGDPAELLARLLDAGDAAAHTERQTLRVTARGASGEAHMRVGFIFGTGLVASFFELYNAAGARGSASAARLVARIFVESFYGGPVARRVLDPMPCTIEVDGAPLGPRAWSLVCASVVRDLGIHMRVTYRAGEDPDRLHLVASPLSPAALGPRAPLVLLGRRIGGEGHHDGLVRSFTVDFGGRGGAYVLDGDLLRAASVEVAPGPRVRVLDPPR